MEKEEDQSKHEWFQVVRGHPFPHQFPGTTIFFKKYLEDAMDYLPKDNDVIIASYPKTGTTWIQYIHLQITSRAQAFHSFDDMTLKVYPYLEMSGTAAVEALTGNRTYKHHIPYNLVKKNPKAKTIYTYRNPEDTVVSFFHFTRASKVPMPPTFEEFVDCFVTGDISYGSYFKHVLSFYEHREDPNLLMVSYEKLHSDRRNEILRIAKFLGEEHYEYLRNHEDVLEKVIEHTTFDYMKKNLSMSLGGKKEVNFFRKGIVGDGKNMLNEEQKRKIKEAAQILEQTTIYKEWYP